MNPDSPDNDATPPDGSPEGEAGGDAPPEVQPEHGEAAEVESEAPPPAEAGAETESEAGPEAEAEVEEAVEPEAEAEPAHNGATAPDEVISGAVAATAVGAPTANGGPMGNGGPTTNGGPRPAGGMRGMIDDLESPHPLGTTLPGVLQDDEFAQRFVSGLDAVLAPVFSTLDNIDTYLDPQLTPPDFLPWLAGWHGAEVDAGWPEERSRDLMSRLPQLQAGRGTIAVLREMLLLHTGSEPEIIDSGGAAWSAVPGGELPGSDACEVHVRVKGQGIDRARIESLVNEATPAHIVVHVEVVD